MAAAHPALIRTCRGHFLARGRTANISETGVFIIARCPDGPPRDEEVVVEIELPSAAATARGRRPGTREVRYRCRVVRTRTLGHLVGLGVEFMEKIA